MTKLKTVPMHTIMALVITNALAIICIYIANRFLGMTYDTEGSFDILTGAFVEVLILSAYFEFINARGQKNMESHLQNHLRHIEQLIKQKPAE